MQGTALFEEKTRELSRSTKHKVSYNAPGGLVYRPFQNAGIHFGLRLLNQNKNVLIADPPGLGKTIQAIGIINEIVKHHGSKAVLIVVPASLQANWHKELNTWLWPFKNGKMSVAYLDTKGMRKGVKAQIMIASYGIMSQKGIAEKIQEYFKYDLLILDEVHYLKNPKSNRTKAVLARNGLSRQASMGTIAMTGTPIVNRPIELFPVVAGLCPVAINHKSFFEYGLRYCAGKKETKRAWGGRTIDAWNFDGASNLKELGTKLRSHFMIRRKKEDVLHDLPDKTVSVVYLDPSPGVKKVMKSGSILSKSAVLSKKSFSEFDLDEDEDNLSSYRRGLGIEKAPLAAEYIKTQLESGQDKVVVFAHHNDVLDVLKEQLHEFGVVEIRGKTSREQRGRAVESFQENKGTRVFLGSITAAGVGLTLTAASYVAVVEPSWVPGENEQAIDRTHRMGQKNHVLAEYLLFENDLDDIMLRTNVLKQMNIERVVE